MMTATMAAAAATKDTNQLKLTNVNTNNNNNNFNDNTHTHTSINNNTPTGSNGYPLERKPFYQHATTTISKLIMPPVSTAIPTTAASTTTIDSTINIGLTHHTHAHKQTSDSGVINERVQRVTDSANDVVVVDVEYEDDDDGNVDGNGFVYADCTTAVTPIVKTGVLTPSADAVDANFSVDSTRRTHAGLPVASGGLNINYGVEYVHADDVDDDDDDDSDSFGSMETLSDNVAVWVDGEKHWVAGVDANTTCADLIGALLNYQNAQKVEDNQQQQNHHPQQQDNPHNLYHQRHQQQSQQHQHHMFHNNNKAVHKNNENANNSKVTTSSNNNNITTNTSINQSTLIKTLTNTKENCGVDSSLLPSSAAVIGGCLASSTAAPRLPVLAPTVPENSNGVLPIVNNRLLYAHEYVIVKQHRHCEEYLDGNAKVFDILPVGIDGPSRKECELLLRHLSAANNINSNNTNINSNTNNGTALTALPTTMQRRLISPTLHLNTQVSSLLSTDKDSGMGSPVGSSRSARLRRRKYKSAATVSWLAQANTLHPRVSQRAVAAFTGLSNTLNNGAHNGNDSKWCSAGESFGKHLPALIEHALRDADGLEVANALNGLGAGVGVGLEAGGSANERLLKIILAQNETINRQLVLLREKERQISKIEEEKHRARERDLGKNYLLETYLNGLDEVAVEQNVSEACTDVVLLPVSSYNEFNDVRVADKAIVGHVDHFDDGNNDVDIYIDEPPHQRDSTTRTKTKKDITGTKITKSNNAGTRHSKKMKGDFTGDGGGGGIIMRGANNDANEPTKTTTDNRQPKGNEKEIEAQLFWLEKIYALNKQLQREEETLLKLHAKVRKHQVKRAYQTKREVLQQIEKLDAELTLQCCDIRAVENKLHTSNEQLKQKLSVLERLSQEFIETMSDAEEGRVKGGGGEEDEAGVEQAITVGGNGQRTVNRMPDIIANDKHILATITTTTGVELRDAEELLMARQHDWQVAAADDLHTKQLIDVTQQQQLGCEGEGKAQDVKQRNLPHATQAGEHDLNENLYEISAKTNVMIEGNIKRMEEQLNVALNSNTTTTTTEAATTNRATTATNAMKAACHAPMALTATSGSASKSNTQAITTTTTMMMTATTTMCTTASTFACSNNMQQTNSVHLQRQQQQQQQPAHLHLATADNVYNNNNSHQCVIANDVLIFGVDDATAAVGGATQSNYPISYINQAAIHATSQHLTKQIVVAADVPNATLKLAMSEQITPTTAVATLPVGYLTSSSSQSTSSAPASSITPTATTTVNYQQQQQQQTQIIHNQQHWQHNSMTNNNISSTNNNKNNNKNLLAPSLTYADHISTKTLQKQMFNSNSLNQMLPTMATPKIIPQTTAALTALTAPSAASAATARNKNNTEDGTVLKLKRIAARKDFL
ncbi:serine-rich adhesin for platelets [Eurosta solidaginis]|uniref:serine-rich adhesin for platelets n=1 Tax=Eurosta solidaginis TaxID=178769 RepID=UPI00353174CE